MRCYRCGAEIGDDVKAFVSWHAVADGGQVKRHEHKAWLCEDCYSDFTGLMEFAPARGDRRGPLDDEPRAKYGFMGKL